MIVRRIAFVILMLMVCSQASAEITLKKGFFSGWQYSTDGMHYRKVGMSGNDLRFEVSGNEEARASMEKYKTANTWAVVTGTPGGILVGWPLGSYIGSGGEWKDSYTTMLAIGAPLCIISMVFESSAGRNLKQAVAQFNGDVTTSLGFKLNIQPQMDESGTLALALKCEF